jgi:DNA-binding NarL/FixJ family response regulator
MVHLDARTSSFSPPDVWCQLVAGRLTLTKHFPVDDRIFLVARDSSTEAQSTALSSRESELFCRLLMGQSQKLMGYELGVCPSTVATHIARAFAKLGLQPSANAVPLALVLICQGARGAIHLSAPHVTSSVREGQRYVIASIARPPVTRLLSLTAAERDVALALVDGYSKFDIARARSTSIHTIGRQISSLFAKLNVKGRFDLICRMSQ